ncbi:MAG: aldo/keto reductase [Chloroflexi bacterium]|nr:aldo/keto reductase [Chloroflexota bacterium]
MTAMQYRKLGRTGLEVSAIGFGTWPMSAVAYGAIDDQEVTLAVNQALDAGINIFDTARGYGDGRSEVALGKALGHRRNEAVIVTKCGNIPAEPRGFTRDSTRASIFEEIEGSLRRLGTDVIDVYLVHWPDPRTPFEETMTALDDLVRQGKARFVGASNFSVEQLETCMRLRRIDVIQVPWQLFDQRMAAEVLPWAQRHEVGVMGYSTLANGLLTGGLRRDTAFGSGDWRASGAATGQMLFSPENLPRNVEVVERLRSDVAVPLGKTVAQVALAWAMRHPALSSSLVGPRRPSELEDNLGALTVSLSSTDLSRIDEIVQGAAGIVRVWQPFSQPYEPWS